MGLVMLCQMPQGGHGYLSSTSQEPPIRGPILPELLVTPHMEDTFWKSAALCPTAVPTGSSAIVTAWVDPAG